MTAPCELCQHAGGIEWYRDDRLRVVLVQGEEGRRFPGFIRVVWNAHVREMTNLLPADRSYLMMTVCKVEQALRDVLNPTKINLASLGNVTPHLHWHVIPRWDSDSHFPAPVWAQAVRDGQVQVSAGQIEQLKTAVLSLLSGA